jgi:small subunit ribosomal protein S18
MIAFAPSPADGPGSFGAWRARSPRRRPTIVGIKDMSKFARFGPVAKPRITKVAPEGRVYVDWKDVETLRRLMSPNGKILGRKRLGASAAEQRLLSQAIKRARFMALLPYTSATV